MEQMQPAGAGRQHMPTQVLPDAREVSAAVAGRIAELIRDKSARGETCVLGLATGSTPMSVYKEPDR